MYYLIYISSATKYMDKAELTVLLDQSRKKNIELGITGVLLYAEGTFIQMLEGEKDAVDKVFGWVKEDTRHKNVIELSSEEQEKRTFPNWTMGFIAPEGSQIAELAGYINPMQNKLFKETEHNTAITILKTFAENNGMLR